MSHLLKEIPKDTKAPYIEVYFDNKYFGRVRTDILALPTPQYMVVLAVCNTLFTSSLEPIMKDMLVEGGLGGLIELMSGLGDEEVTKKWVAESEMMQHFDVRESFGFEGTPGEVWDIII